MKLTNNEGLSLSVAVWLASDNYDYNNDPNHLSATEIMKPLRQLILAPRVPSQDISFDIAERIPSAMGTALHNGIEQAWENGGYKRALKKIGMSEDIINRIVLNPTDEELTEIAEWKELGMEAVKEPIVVYMEKRLTRKLGKWTISGKPDFIGQGMLEDFKSTGVYSYIKGNSDDKFCKQGSIYRWIDPVKIVSEHIVIQYIFTDWSKLRAMTEDKYPDSRVMAYRVPLWSEEKTEAYLLDKLTEFERLFNAPQDQIPECTTEQLWQDPSVYKYYKNPANTKRSTKNYTEYHEAHARQLADASVGMIVEVKGKVKRCMYCAAFTVCEQKDQLILAGLLEIDE